MDAVTPGAGSNDRPMVLIVPDEAAGLLSERSPEGDLARLLPRIERAASYGRKADIRVSVSRQAMDRLSGPGHSLRFILRAILKDQWRRERHES